MITAAPIAEYALDLPGCSAHAESPLFHSAAWRSTFPVRARVGPHIQADGVPSGPRVGPSVTKARMTRKRIRCRPASDTPHRAGLPSLPTGTALTAPSRLTTQGEARQGRLGEAGSGRARRGAYLAPRVAQSSGSMDPTPPLSRHPCTAERPPAESRRFARHKSWHRLLASSRRERTIGAGSRR